MKVEFIQTEHINIMWPHVEPFIKSAIDASGVDDYSLDNFKMRLTDGLWQALVAVDDEREICGAAVVHFFNRPKDRVGYIMAIGGKLISNEDTFEQLKNYMKINGATRIEGSARESVARLWTRYGFTEKYRVVGVSI